MAHVHRIFIPNFAIYRNFYGSIRLYDTMRMHFIIFYIEPTSNQVFYSASKRKKREAEDKTEEAESEPPKKSSDSNATKPPEKSSDSNASEPPAKSSDSDASEPKESSGPPNAILFEYIPHDDVGASEKKKRKRTPSEDDYYPFEPTKMKNLRMDRKARKMGAENDEDNNDGKDHPHPKASITFNQSNILLNKEYDIVGKTEFKTGVSSSNIFDLRRFVNGPYLKIFK